MAAGLEKLKMYQCLELFAFKKGWLFKNQHLSNIPPQVLTLIHFY